MDSPRLFTRDEANALLPTIEPTVAELRREASVAREAAPDVEELGRRASVTGGTRPSDDERRSRDRLGRAQARMLDAIRELHGLGVVVKDVDQGLLDFPSERDGEIVELCWLHGEPAVDHWHRVGEGFAGRKPL